MHKWIYILMELQDCIIEVHLASKETFHFFTATLTKIHRIKINHIWTQISYTGCAQNYLQSDFQHQ